MNSPFSLPLLGLATSLIYPCPYCDSVNASVYDHEGLVHVCHECSALRLIMVIIRLCIRSWVSTHEWVDSLTHHVGYPLCSTSSPSAPAVLPLNVQRSIFKLWHVWQVKMRETWQVDKLLINFATWQVANPTMQKISRRNNKPNTRRKEDFLSQLGLYQYSTRDGTALEKLIQNRRKAWLREAHKNSLENNADKFVLYIRALSYMLLIQY